MSYIQHTSKQFDMDLFLTISPAEFEYRMTGIHYTGPYNMKDYFTPSAIKLIKECEGCRIQHVTTDTVYLVDMDYNVTEYPNTGHLIRAEQLVQMNTTPFLEPQCIHVIEYFEQNSIPYNFDFIICGKYLVIKPPLDIQTLIQTFKQHGYPISVKPADSAYIVTDKRKIKRKDRRKKMGG